MRADRFSTRVILGALVVVTLLAGCGEWPPPNREESAGDSGMKWDTKTSRTIKYQFTKSWGFDDPSGIQQERKNVQLTFIAPPLVAVIKDGIPQGTFNMTPGGLLQAAPGNVPPPELDLLALLPDDLTEKGKGEWSRLRPHPTEVQENPDTLILQSKLEMKPLENGEIELQGYFRIVKNQGALDFFGHLMGPAAGGLPYYNWQRYLVGNAKFDDGTKEITHITWTQEFWPSRPDLTPQEIRNSGRRSTYMLEKQ